MKPDPDNPAHVAAVAISILALGLGFAIIYASYVVPSQSHGTQGTVVEPITEPVEAHSGSYHINNTILVSGSNTKFYNLSIVIYDDSCTIISQQSFGTRWVNKTAQMNPRVNITTSEPPVYISLLFSGFRSYPDGAYFAVREHMLLNASLLNEPGTVAYVDDTETISGESRANGLWEVEQRCERYISNMTIGTASR